MDNEQTKGEAFREEDRLRDKPKVDGPLVQETSAELKGSREVGWCAFAERVAIEDL